MDEESTANRGNFCRLRIGMIARLPKRVEIKQKTKYGLFPDDLLQLSSAVARHNEDRHWGESTRVRISAWQPDFSCTTRNLSLYSAISKRRLA